MAGLKLSAKAQEEFEFLESLIAKCDHLLALTEQYAGGKGAAQDQVFQLIVRSLQQVRQKAMIKNLGPIADAVFTLFYRFVAGPPPPDPFTLCGPDPTDTDTLFCGSFDPCP